MTKVSESVFELGSPTLLRSDLGGESRTKEFNRSFLEEIKDESIFSLSILSSVIDGRIYLLFEYKIYAEFEYSIGTYRAACERVSTQTENERSRVNKEGSETEVRLRATRRAVNEKLIFNYYSKTSSRLIR